MIADAALELGLLRTFSTHLWLRLVWVPLFVSALFVMWSYRSVERHLGVGVFTAVGMPYLLGAAVTIVEIGYLPIGVALALNVVAFLLEDDKRQVGFHQGSLELPS